MNTYLCLSSALITLLLFTVGCGSQSEPLAESTLKASCGMCQFGLKNQNGCHINVEVDGKHFPVVGAPKVSMEEMHAPGGYCVSIRNVKVSGKVDGDRFLASSWELLPLEADAPMLPAAH